MNRIDEVVIFHSLSKEHLVKIVDMLINEVNERLVVSGMHLEIADDAKEWLINEGFESQHYGARPMQRAIQRYIEPPSEEIIKGGSRRRRG